MHSLSRTARGRENHPRTTALPGVFEITAETLAKACASYADDKKAEDIVVLDLQGISSFTDYFVICSGTSEPHLKAIAGEIEERLRDEHGIRAVSVDGFPASQWIVLDYLQVIVHVFRREKREFYSLEDLWGDAPRVAWEPAETGASSTSA
ncbi:MAG TPA: ribosome silencing factor [Chthoniobacterales bacterium]|nr:ribosome silencing factor [Chthoniobacterales bacterium]